jgi:YVTN family beta-propeller protein
MVATVAVVKDRSGVAYDRARGEIQLTSEHSDTVNVISSATDKVVATITVGRLPVGEGWDPVSGGVYVSSLRQGTVSILQYVA